MNLGHSCRRFSRFSCAEPESNNPFLEKENHYKRVNEEIEEKSSDLFLRIEQFSKSRRLHFGNIGKSQSLHGGDEALSLSEDEEETLNTKNGQGYEYSFSDGDGDGVTSLTQKLAFLSSNTRKNHKGEGKPGRLQRATESVIKSLQAKLVNHEERLGDLHIQYRQKIQENTILESKVKILEEEREKMFKTIGTLQGTVEKHAKNASDSKSNLSLKEATVGVMKKEIEEMKREQRIQHSTAQTFQSRLHRTSEENERLKNQVKSLGQQLRDVNSEFRQKLDEQAQRINELERQKIVLHSTIQKQAQAMEKMKKRGSHGGRLNTLDPDDSQSCFSS